MYPCVRESLLTGIGGAFGVGGLRAVLGGELAALFLIMRDYLGTEVLRRAWIGGEGRACDDHANRTFAAPIPKAANWAVGTFMLAGLASFEFCQYKRQMEKAHMKRAVEIIDKKKAKQEAQMKERRILREEMDKKAEAAKKSSWKFW